MKKDKNPVQYIIHQIMTKAEKRLDFYDLNGKMEVTKNGKVI